MEPEVQAAESTAGPLGENRSNNAVPYIVADPLRNDRVSWEWVVVPRHHARKLRHEPLDCIYISVLYCLLVCPLFWTMILWAGGRFFTCSSIVRTPLYACIAAFVISRHENSASVPPSVLLNRFAVRGLCDFRNPTGNYKFVFFEPTFCRARNVLQFRLRGKGTARRTNTRPV